MNGLKSQFLTRNEREICLLYTSDAADEEDSVDLGGRRIIKKISNENRANAAVIIMRGSNIASCILESESILIEDG